MNEQDFNDFFAKQLIIARTKENLTQNSVALDLGVANNGTIGRYENGDRQPSLFNLYQMMNLYKTDANFYFPLKDCQKHSKDIPVFVVVQDSSDTDKIKKAISLLSVNDELSNCFALVVDNDSMCPLIMKNDIIIFEKTKEIVEDGVYLLKQKGQEKSIIRNVSLSENGYILYTNDSRIKPVFKSKKEVSPIAQAKELRHRF